jgi:hypothetical protein
MHVRAGFEKGKNQIDDCGWQISDGDQGVSLPVNLRFEIGARWNRRATSFRFCCRLESNRGWETRGI